MEDIGKSVEGIRKSVEDLRTKVEDIEKKVSLDLGKDVMRRKGEQTKWGMAVTLTGVVFVNAFWW